MAKVVIAYTNTITKKDVELTVDARLMHATINDLRRAPFCANVGVKF